MAASHSLEESVSVGVERECDVEKAEACARCHMNVLRQMEREAVDLEYRCPNFTEYRMMLWHAETAVTGKFHGYCNSELDGATEFLKRVVAADLGRKTVACDCDDYDPLVFGHLALVKPEYRDMVSTLFGDTLSVGQLLQLPVGTIDWSYMGVFGVETLDESRLKGVIFNGGQVSLANYLLLARREVYGHEQDWFRTDKKMLFARYGYAQVVLPRFRSVAITYLKAFPDVIDIWSLPLAWIDWQAITEVQLSAFSTFAVWRAGQFPESTTFSEASKHFLVDRLLEMPVGAPGLLASSEEAADSSRDGLWLQSVAVSSFDVGKVERVIHVLGKDDVLCASGWSRFCSPEAVVLSFPAGRFIEVAGVRYGKRGIRVCVRFKGEFICNIVGDGGRDDVVNGILVRVSSDSTELCGWLSDRFDSIFVHTKFLASMAPMVVLRWPVYTVLGEATSGAQRGPVAGTKRVGVPDLEGPAASSDFDRDRCVLAVVRGTEFSHLNDCVVMARPGCRPLGAASEVVCDAGPRDYVDVVWYADVGTMREVVGGSVLSDYSGSDAVVDDVGWHSRESRGRRLSDMSRDDLAAVPGYCYVGLYSLQYYQEYAERFGANPPLGRILGAGLQHFRPAFDCVVALMLVSRGWHLVPVSLAVNAVPWPSVMQMWARDSTEAMATVVGSDRDCVSARGQVESLLARVGHVGELSERFVSKLEIVAGPGLALAASEKETLRLLRYCGESLVSSEMALAAVRADLGVAEYLDRRSVAVSPAFLTRLFREGFDVAGFDEPLGVGMDVEVYEAETLAAIIGLIAAELGRDRAVAAFAVLAGFEV